ncbi:hypothetical protein C8R45DRAFT_974602 [Mycena sanguinolenta]|nr:hypothetical protein C8R45DRAFT_974602 [Mycena sanguinolenta]
MSTSGPQYVHYTGPHQQQPATVSPLDTQRAPPKAPPPRLQPAHTNTAASSSNTINAVSNPGPSTSGAQQPPATIVAKGNWTKDLVQLALTAELKKHALTLQLHTAHILSAHASLEQKNRAVQDIREQRNKLESERQRLIECLAQVNEDRNQADLLEATLERERVQLRTKIAQLSDGEYKAAKADVDRLRADLGQPPLPTLQETLDGKGAGYLTERRTAGAPSAGPSITPQGQAAAAEKKRKRAGNGTNGSDTNGVGEHTGAEDGGQVKRSRGRPRGSRNRGGAPG